jgi:hypothetical protein
MYLPIRFRASSRSLDAFSVHHDPVVPEVVSDRSAAPGGMLKMQLVDHFY